MQTQKDTTMVAPALDKYAQGALAELWKRPGLTPRDRSIVTIAALISRNQTIEMAYYFNLALDNGVKPREISEIITHLAFYSGWANAMAAAAVAKDAFADVRFADDFVAGFQHRYEAEQFLAELRERFAHFGLQLHADKTRIVEFGRFAEQNRRQRGEGKPETFNFLGFTHICGRTRKRHAINPTIVESSPIFQPNFSILAG